jgi:hypothetical protein
LNIFFADGQAQAGAGFDVCNGPAVVDDFVAESAAMADKEREKQRISARKFFKPRGSFFLVTGLLMDSGTRGRAGQWKAQLFGVLARQHSRNGKMSLVPGVVGQKDCGAPMIAQSPVETFSIIGVTASRGFFACGSE